MRNVYKSLEEPGDDPLKQAHKELDDAVRQAYKMPDDAETIKFLMELNQKLAKAEKSQRKEILGPGLPAKWSQVRELFSIDCIDMEGNF